ncbi:hypothetical protein G9A89_023683 [Geosiphon pyriformis]|nr:hypothetical protein G9A89_023683 [Geosiphon pyriformis]
MSEKLARKAVEDLLKYRTSIRTLLPISTEDTRQKVSSSSNENIQSLHKTSKTINKNTKLPPTKTGLKKIKDKKRREAMLAAIEHRKEEKGRVNPLEQIRKEKETRKFNLKHNLNYFKSSQLESIKEKELKKKILELQLKEEKSFEATFEKTLMPKKSKLIDITF